MRCSRPCGWHWAIHLAGSGHMAVFFSILPQADGGAHRPRFDRAITNTIRSVYNARLKAHYKAVRVTAADSTDSLRTARQILQLVATALGLPQGGIAL
jgi:DNA gyrase/topoisomerase IV subunit B